MPIPLHLEKLDQDTDIDRYIRHFICIERIGTLFAIVVSDEQEDYSLRHHDASRSTEHPKTAREFGKVEKDLKGEKAIMKILVVDDEPMQLKSMKIGLRTEGYTVVTAESAEEALKVLNSGPAVDLIITDFLMAGMSGMDLLKSIRSVKSSTPVILMTAYGKKDLVVEAWKNQCNGFIEKPFSLEELLTEISRVRNIENA